MCETSIVSCSTKVSGLGATPVKSANLTTWCLRVWLFAALLANACSAAEPGLGTPARQQEMDGYKLVWADEFNQEGPPDPNAWSFEKGLFATASSNGIRKRTRSAAMECWSSKVAESESTIPGFKKAIKTGDEIESLPTTHRLAFILAANGAGRTADSQFVLRSMRNKGCGLPFGRFGSARYWPGCGEVDVMEYYQGRILANAYWLGQNNSVMWDSEKIPVSNLGKGWANQFHVWQLDWDAKEMVISLDGKSLNSIDLTEAVNRDSEGTQPFQEPHYILLNLAIGGTQGGDPSGTKFPTQYLVDYVRVYQRLGE